MNDGPGFLVVGAQKCGTTTLYEDLRSHPGVFLPDKESSGLLAEDLPSPGAVAAYQRLFRQAGDRLAGEVSTRYTMLPVHDVASVAAEVLGEARVLYVVREPIARVISHHHHDHALGLVSADIDVEVRRTPALVDNSRYATQIDPWLRAFGPERVMVIRFETFVADRQGTANRVAAFLGLPSWTLPHTGTVHNAAESKVVATAGWRRLLSHPAYRRVLRPLVPEALRRRATRAVLPSAVARPPAPSPDTVTWLVDELRPEVERLGEVTGEGPWWDLDRVQAASAPEGGR